ncbi:MAG: VWA-like domain-containing protein, partial [bacterium]|nr:VWA-like domain-containing protein [bacterium]
LIVEETITKLNSSPSGLRRADIKLPTNICLDHKYKNWSSEQVYEDLTKKSQGQNKKGDKGQRGESGEKVVGKTAWDEFCAGSSFGKNTGPGEAKSAAESEALKEEWKDRITRAADIAKKQGKLPGGFESLIDDLLQPKLPWKNLLSRFIQSTIYDDYRIMPPHRNHVYRGIYLPSEFGEALEIAVALDTSGSISDEELTIFISEVLGICKITNNFKIHYYAADARVAEKRIIGTYDTIPNKFPGRGGTDFRPVFDDIEENNINPSVLVYFTDGEGPFPRSAPNYPVIWLMTTDVQPPFGTIIKYDKYI